MNDSKPNPIEFPENTDVLNIVTELGIPGPVQKGFLKAMSQLMGAFVDIPIAWLERPASRIRATTDAQNTLTKATANKLIKDFGGGSELANRAVAQHASRILREQVNLEDVLAVAANELIASGTSSNPDSEPDDDWLNNFRNEACQKSSEEMKHAFGRILAGEIQQPGRFSIKSVRTLSLLDLPTALLFQKFCNMTISIPKDEARVCSLGGNPASNSLQEFGMPFDNLLKLEELGLIISDFNSWREFGLLVLLKAQFSIGTKRFLLSPREGFSGSFKMHGVVLTSVGRELFQIVDREDKPKYVSALTKFLEKNMIAMKELHTTL